MGERSDISRISPPVSASETPLGKRPFKNILCGGVIPALTEYHTLLAKQICEQPDVESEDKYRRASKSMPEFSRRLAELSHAPQLTEVRTKIPIEGSRLHMGHLLLRTQSTFSQNRWYEIAINFPVIPKDLPFFYPWIELRPSKIRRTAQNGIENDPLPIGLTIGQQQETVLMQGVLYTIRDGAIVGETYIPLQKTITSETFKKMSSAVDRTFTLIRRQAQKA